MESMTGFGSSTARGTGFQITAEARSVNSKSLSLSVNLPESMAELETDVRTRVKDLFQRGRIKVNVVIEIDADDQRFPSVNMDVADRYIEFLHSLCSKYNITDELSADALLRLPGVSTMDKSSTIDSEELHNSFQECVGICLEGLKESRCAEGLAVRSVFEDGFRFIREMAEPVLELHHESVEERYARLQDRVAQLAGNIALDQNRCIQELAIMVDRSDISEEIQRLHSHLDHAEDIISSNPISMGRLLGFVIQEIHRELNTMGSKVDDAQLSHRIIQMKNTLASLKEQVANIE